MADDSEDSPHTGALFVALPSISDPVNELSEEEQAHVTLLWFGDAAELWPMRVDALREHVTEVARALPPFTARVSGTAELGPDRARVLLVESVGLVELRQALFASPDAQAAHLQAEQFPWWVPHLTVSYTGWPDAPIPDTIDFDGVGLWLGGQHERFVLKGPSLEDSIREGEPDDGTTQDELLSSGLTIPPVLEPDDLPLCMSFADQHPDARWYAERRARALGRGDLIPAGWAVA